MAYPASLDNLTDDWASADPNRLVGPDVDTHAASINAVQTELGTDPAGSEATVKARLDALDTTVAAKQAGDSDLTTIAALSPSNDDVIQRKSGVWVARSMAQIKTDLALAKGDVGLGNVDNTSDANKPVSTAQAAADAAIAATYRSAIPTRTGLMAQSTVAGTYFIDEGSIGIFAASTNDSRGAIGYLDPADYAIAGLTTKYRLRAVLYTNATAPHATAITFIAGLYPITAVAGGSNAGSMTPGTVESGSTVTFTNPSASTRYVQTTADFTAPAAGHYALGFVTNANTAAASAEVISIKLDVRNT